MPDKGIHWWVGGELGTLVKGLMWGHCMTETTILGTNDSVLIKT